MIGDPDPYTAIMNAVQYFHIYESSSRRCPRTLAVGARDNLVERVRERDATCPVEHVEAATDGGEA